MLALIISSIVFGGGSGPQQGQAQQLQPGQKIDPALLQWPRFAATNGYEFAVYQPQIGTWQGNQLEGRFALAVRPAGTTNETYGVIFFKTRTEIDKVNRLVTLEDFEVTKADFPTQKEMQNAVFGDGASLPAEHGEGHPAGSPGSGVRGLGGHVEGEGRAGEERSAAGDLYDAAVAAGAGGWGADLQAADGRLPAGGEHAGGAAAEHELPLPGQLPLRREPVVQRAVTGRAVDRQAQPAARLDAALEAAQATKEVDLLLPQDTNAPPPLLQVYVSTVPAELIETTGAANMLSIQGTELLYATNTSNAIFYCLDDANYYVLMSGRWFKGVSLYGPWAFVPAGQLPADFQKIPPDHEKSNVLASVPGRPRRRKR